MRKNLITFNMVWFGKQDQAVITLQDIVLTFEKIATMLCEYKSNNELARYDGNSRNFVKLLD